VAEIPPDLRYTSDHEWTRPGASNVVRVGITDYAQGSLGDIVFVTVSSIGESVAAGEAFGEVESTKSVSDLFAPVAGTVVRRNEMLDEHPELVNADPYGDGWIAEIEVSQSSVLDSLLDAEAYRAVTSG